MGEEEAGGGGRHDGERHEHQASPLAQVIGKACRAVIDTSSTTIMLMLWQIMI